MILKASDMSADRMLLYENQSLGTTPIWKRIKGLPVGEVSH